MARAIIGEDWHEVFVDTAPELCRQRDPKGLYAQAEKGRIASFTGVSAAYEPPETPDVIVPGDGDVARSVQHLTDAVHKAVR